MLDPVSSVMTGATKAATAARRPAQIEPGWSCTGSPSVCARTVCGNGILEAGEVCDCGTDPTKLPTDARGRTACSTATHRLLEDLH